MLRTWLQIAHISNLPTIWTNILAAWVVAYGGFQFTQLAALMLGGSLIYSAGMMLNDAADGIFDRSFEPKEPLRTGPVPFKSSWTLAILLFLGGAACLIFNGRANVWLVAALIIASAVYALCHKSWAASSLIMGAWRALLYLVAGYAATGGRRFAYSGEQGWGVFQDGPFSWPRLGRDSFESLIIHAGAIGCYIMGLTLLMRHESRRTGASSKLSMWLVRGLLYVPGVLATVWIAFGGSILNVVLVTAFAGMTALALRHMRRGRPGVTEAMRILLAGIVIVDALAIASVDPHAGLICACGALVLPLWWRMTAPDRKRGQAATG